LVILLLILIFYICYKHASLTARTRKTKEKSFIGLATGVNFINILGAAFTRKDPKSSKKTAKLSIIFALLGSLRVKAARRMLMKLTPGVNSIKRCFYLALQCPSSTTKNLNNYSIKSEKDGSISSN